MDYNYVWRPFDHKEIEKYQKNIDFWATRIRLAGAHKSKNGEFFETKHTGRHHQNVFHKLYYEQNKPIAKDFLCWCYKNNIRQRHKIMDIYIKACLQAKEISIWGNKDSNIIL